MRTIPPLLMMGTRWAIAGILLFVFAIRRTSSEERPTVRQWKSAAIVGSFLILGTNGLVAIAEQEVAASVAGVILGTIPIWMALLAWFLLRERLSWVSAVGILMGFAGTLLLAARGNEGGDATTSATFLVLIAAVIWAVGSTISTRVDLPRAPLLASSMQMICGAAGQLIVGLIRGEGRDLHLDQLNVSSVAALAYLTIFGSLVAYSAYTWLLSHVPISVVATHNYVNPVVALVLGWSLLNESITAVSLVGAAMIVVSVVLVMKGREPSPIPEHA